MRIKNIFGKVSNKDKPVQTTDRSAETERAELKSFISYLHIVLLKVIRDREPIVRMLVPMANGRKNLSITVEAIPFGMQPADRHFILNEDQLGKAIQSVTFNPTEEQLDEAINGEKTRL